MFVTRRKYNKLKQDYDHAAKTIAWLEKISRMQAIKITEQQQKIDKFEKKAEKE